MSITIWTLYTERVPGEAVEKPFVSFRKPDEDVEKSFQIARAENINSGPCWRFFSTGVSKERPFLFFLTDKVRYRKWPMEILTQNIVTAFLCDNKILSK
jgi:hypothetical protein